MIASTSSIRFSWILSAGVAPPSNRCREKSQRRASSGCWVRWEHRVTVSCRMTAHPPEVDEVILGAGLLRGQTVTDRRQAPHRAPPRRRRGLLAAPGPPDSRQASRQPRRSTRKPAGPSRNPPRRSPGPAGRLSPSSGPGPPARVGHVHRFGQCPSSRVRHSIFNGSGCGVDEGTSSHIRIRGWSLAGGTAIPAATMSAI